MLEELNTQNFEQKAMVGLKVIEFYATWCMYCARQRIELDSFKDSAIWIGIVDADESPDICRKFGISSFPTFVILKDGVKVGQFSGFHDKSQLLSKLMTYIDKNNTN